jgi:hypothetical protein
LCITKTICFDLKEESEIYKRNEWIKIASKTVKNSIFLFLLSMWNVCKSKKVEMVLIKETSLFKICNYFIIWKYIETYIGQKCYILFDYKLALPDMKCFCLAKAIYFENLNLIEEMEARKRNKFIQNMGIFNFASD